MEEWNAHQKKTGVRDRFTGAFERLDVARLSHTTNNRVGGAIGKLEGALSSGASQKRNIFYPYV